MRHMVLVLLVGLLAWRAPAQVQHVICWNGAQRVVDEDAIDPAIVSGPAAGTPFDERVQFLGAEGVPIDALRGACLVSAAVAPERVSARAFAPPVYECCHYGADGRCDWFRAHCFNGPAQAPGSPGLTTRLLHALRLR